MTVGTPTTVAPQVPDILEAIERALVGQTPFGESRYILEHMQVCLTYRLERLAVTFAGARDLLAACKEAGNVGLEHVLGETVVRCAILHAHTRLVGPPPSWALGVEDCELIFAATARHIRAGRRDTPLSDGSLTRLGPGANYPVLWSEAHQDDVFGHGLRQLLQPRYNALPVTPTESEQAQVTRGIALLDELLPALGSSALSHTHALAMVPSAGRFTNVGSASQFDLGGTIFLGRTTLTPWWVAEHVFHEALHQKLYDFRHAHSLLALDVAHGVDRPVCALWNPPRLDGANRWNVHRVFAAFHVYTHLTLFAMVAEQREDELAGEYGSRADTVDSLRAFERAWYLGERLKLDCWELLGTAGREMVTWLLTALEFMNPSPPPPGANIHLYLDRFLRESREAERARRETPSRFATQLESLARDELDAARAILAEIGATGPLERLESATNADPDVHLPQLRLLIADVVSEAAHDRYQLTESGEFDEQLRALVEDGSNRLHPILANHPPAVAAGRRRAAELAFRQSCSDDVGRLLAVFAGTVPRDGRILEIGTAVGVGTAWITSGLGARTDVDLVSVDRDERLIDAARTWPWPPYVTMLRAEGIEALDALGSFDFIFADAAPIKYGHFDAVVEALRPRGLLVIDDTHIGTGASESVRDQLEILRRSIRDHPGLTSLELDWASGVIVACKTDA